MFIERVGLHRNDLKPSNPDFLATSILPTFRKKVSIGIMGRAPLRHEPFTGPPSSTLIALLN